MKKKILKGAKMDYSIANTTKEERLAIVKNALGISIS
jgi:hypothetical protein